MPINCDICKSQSAEANTFDLSQPCPNCSIGRVHEIVGAVDTPLRAGDSADVSLIYGNTQRELRFTAISQCVQEWAMLHDRESILNHSLTTNFKTELQKKHPISSNVLKLVRGIPFESVNGEVPSVERMIPTRKHQHKGGRYHGKDELAFYLSESKDGVFRELESNLQGKKLYMVDVNVPIDELDIADFTDVSTDSLICNVFAAAEHCNVEGREGPKNYIFSQAIAKLVSETYDGMRVPGVRGEKGSHYKNVILFNYPEKWVSWASMSGPPYEYIDQRFT